MAIVMALLLTVMNTPPIEGDLALLEVMRDAQRSFQGRYPQGELSYSFEAGVVEGGEDKLQQRVDGRLVWNGTKIRFQGELGTYFLPPGVKEPETNYDPIHVIDMIRDEKIMSVHWIKANTVKVSDSAKVGPPSCVDLTPEASWSGIAKPRPWIHLLGPHPEFPQDRVKRYVVKRLDDDKIELVREDLDGSRLRLVASREADGQIVEDQSKAGSSSQALFLSCRWARDSQDRLYLVEMTTRMTYDCPIRKRTINNFKKYKTTHFDPDYRPAPSVFDHAAFKRIAGARIEDEVAGKTYIFGREPKKKTEDGLNRLIEEVKSRGFARP